MKFNHAILILSLFLTAAGTGCGRSIASNDVMEERVSTAQEISRTESSATDVAVTPQKDSEVPVSNETATPPDAQTPPQTSNDQPDVIVDPAPPIRPDRPSEVLAGGATVMAPEETPTQVIDDNTEIENVRVDVMIPDFRNAGGERLGVVFCPTSDFEGPDCVRLRLDQDDAEFDRNQLVSYLLKPSDIAPYVPVARQATSISDIFHAREASLRDLRVRDLSYFRLYALGSARPVVDRPSPTISSDREVVGFGPTLNGSSPTVTAPQADDVLFVGGVALSVQSKGSNVFAPVYRNPCVNRWIESQWADGKWAYRHTSDHSLKGDEAICVYSRVSDADDAGTDDLISIEIPLSKKPGATTTEWMDHFQAGSELSIRYNEDRNVISTSLQYNRVTADGEYHGIWEEDDDYNDFRGNHATSYGFTVYHSNGSLEPTFNLRTNGGDWLKLEEFNVYRIQPGSQDFLNNKTCSAFLSKRMTEDGDIPALSTDEHEGLSSWSKFDHEAISGFNGGDVCRQFETIRPGSGTKAFGVK